MTTHREGIFVEGLWREPTKKDSDAVSELGVTSAPLLSMAYAFNASCKDYSEDFMLCKNDNQDPKACLLEGRKVTRCAQKLVNDLLNNCKTEWEGHYECLDKNNQMLVKCRKPEGVFNDCVLKKLGLKKVIPDTPEDQIPIHLKPNPSFK